METCCYLLINFRSIFVNSFRFSTETTTLSANKDNFMSSFPNFLYFLFLLYYNSKDFNMLKWSGEREQPCFVPYLSGKASSFPLLINYVSCGVSAIFIKLRKLPLYSQIHWVFFFSWMGIGYCWMLFLCLLTLWFFFFSLLMWWTT